MFASTGSATHSGSLATATFKRVASGSGTNAPSTADLALFVSSEKTDWKTSTVQGEIDGISIGVRQGENGDAGAILINGKKVAGDGTYGMTGVEGALYSTDGTSDVTGHHFGVKFTAGSILNAGSSDVRDGGIGFNAGALVGDVDGESPKTAFLARGDGNGGKWSRVLVASSSNLEADSYFQITSGTNGETPTMRFGKPASGSVTVRNISGTFQTLNHSGDPILNLIESTKQATFFGDVKLGGNSAPGFKILYGGSAVSGVLRPLA